MKQLYRVQADAVVYVRARSRDEARLRSYRTLFGRWWIVRFVNRHRRVGVASVGATRINPVRDASKRCVLS